MNSKQRRTARRKAKQTIGEIAKNTILYGRGCFVLTKAGITEVDIYKKVW